MSHLVRPVLRLAAVLALIAVAPAAAAATPQADPTGRVVNGFDLRHIAVGQQIGGVVVAPGGDVVAAGMSGLHSVLTLARYTPAGALDPSFGTGGVAKPPAPPGVTRVDGLLRRPDGRFVVLVSNSSAQGGLVALVGVTASGAVEPSFGTGGVLVLPGFYLSCGACHSAALDSGGGVLIAGSHAGHAAVAGVTSGGKLDPAFGTGGFAVVPSVGILAVVASEPGGDVFALGDTTDRKRTALVRLSPAGALRTTYGSGGVVTIPESTYGDELALGAGKVLVAASNASATGGPGPAVVRRYAGNGAVDAAYGSAGSVQLAIGELYPQLLHGRAGGADVVGDFTGGRGRIARLGPDGTVTEAPRTLAPGFGGGAFSGPTGEVQVTFAAERAPGAGSFDVGAAAERPDGGLVLAGDAPISLDNGGAGIVDSHTWAVESLRPDLMPDPSFGSRQAVKAGIRLRGARLHVASLPRSGVAVVAAMSDRGELEVRITARHHGRTITVARRTIVFLVAKSVDRRVPPTAAGLRLLRHPGGPMRLTVSARATVVGGESRALPHRSLTLR